MKKILLTTIIATGLLLFTGCGSSGSGKDNNETNSSSGSNKTIDFADYLPSSDMTRSYTQYLNGDSFKWGATTFDHKDKVTRKSNSVTYLASHNYQGYENSWVTDSKESKIKIEKNSIDYSFGDIGDIKPYEIILQKGKRIRYIDVGDTSFSSSWESKQLGWGETNCTITKKLANLTHREYVYTGDIIEEMCIRKGKLTYPGYEQVPESYNVSYNYYKKGIGFIAIVDDDCRVETVVQDNGKVTVLTPVDTSGCAVNNMEYIYYIK